MITDLLARKYRFNVPGTKANLNWTRRMQRSISGFSPAQSAIFSSVARALYRNLETGSIPTKHALAHDRVLRDPPHVGQRCVLIARDDNPSRGFPIAEF